MQDTFPSDSTDDTRSLQAAQQQRQQIQQVQDALTQRESTQAGAELSFDQLINDYRDIHLLLNAQWPIESNSERTFARMMKLVEEVGELSNEILTQTGLQRQSKIDAFEEEHVADELADVLGSVLLLAIELNIDIPAALQRKVRFTLERLQQEVEQGA